MMVSSSQSKRWTFSLLLILLSLGACATPDELEGERLGNGEKSGRSGVASAFSQNQPLSDAFFLDSEALSAAGVQAFLERSPYGLRSWLADHQIDGRPASAMIYDVAQSAGVNPILLLSRMQVEASLIASSSRPAQHLIDRAMGCGCPDGQRCDLGYLGLKNQLRCAASKFRELYDLSATGEGWWLRGVGKESLDGYWIVPKNHATAALYAYTPWVLVGSGGTWLAWKMARKFDLHVTDLGLDQLGREGGGSGGGDFCGEFVDLPASHPGFGAVEAAAAAGWISGCTADRFCPEETLTRAQAASVLRSALNLGKPWFSEPPRDAAGHWAQEAIEAVVGAGIMTGCGEKLFCPDATLSRAEAAVVVAKAGQISSNRASAFSDVPADHWASPSIAGLHEQGYIGGCSATEFCLDAPMRRWIFVTWLADVRGLAKKSCR